MTSRLGVMQRHAITSINHLGDNCIQIFYLGRYIVGYTVGNWVYVIYERISDDIPPQMKILNMVIPILMHY